MGRLRRVLPAVFAVLFYLFSGSGLAWAQTPTPFSRCAGHAAMTFPDLACLEDIFNNLLKNSLVLAGILAFLYLIAGGFKYLTAGGDEKAVADARKMLGQAVLGLVFVVGAYALLNVFYHFIFGAGSKILFTIPPPIPTPAIP